MPLVQGASSQNTSVSTVPVPTLEFLDRMSALRPAVTGNMLTQPLKNAHHAQLDAFSAHQLRSVPFAHRLLEFSSTFKELHVLVPVLQVHTRHTMLWPTMCLNACLALEIAQLAKGRPLLVLHVQEG